MESRPKSLQSEIGDTTTDTTCKSRDIKMYRFPRSIPSLIWSQHGRIHIECRSMSTSEKLWGGRFEKDTDEAAVNWAESLTCDHEMVRCCCIYTKVHALMRTNIRLFRIDE